MKQIAICVFLWVVPHSVLMAQPMKLTLDECLGQAVKNHPLNAQNELYEQSTGLQQQIIDLGKLPQLNVNGQATYQNAVTELPISMPGFSAPEIPKLQYKISLDANQLIYGGGAIGYQNELEGFNQKINQANNEAELYKIKERINQLFFSILLTNLNISVINNTINDLATRQAKILAGVKDEILLQSAADVIQAEILKAGQRLLETKAQKKAMVSTLSILTGIPINEETEFEIPAIEVDLSKYDNLRPEFGTFGLMQQKLEVSKKLAATRDLPKVFGFGTLGYGRPGFNMFREEADIFYIAGAKATWNFWNWHQTDREKQLLGLNKQIIENQKNAYDLVNKSQVQQYLADVGKSTELLKSDDEIILLRKAITRSAATQLENGTLTATEFVTEQLAEEQAYLMRNLHQIQLLQAKASYKAATGGL